MCGRLMKKGKGKILAVIVLILVAAVYYYVAIPAVNIHSTGFWTFLIALLVLILAAYGTRKVHSVQEAKENKVLKIGAGVVVLVLAVYGIGTLLSSPVVNAKKYRDLIEPQTRNFAEDIPQISYDQIPILDKDSAELLGNRKMGSMVDMVSQFEVSDLYSQINYQGRPVRVTPLEYASFIKWFTNQKEGIPAYITIDMATQNTELVKLEEGIKYSESEYLNRNIYRHLRFRYPTYIFDQLSFEINEEGVPYWICPVKKYTIGLFGGQTIGRVVLCNAVTGECEDVSVEDCPTWVDRVFPADLLIELYDYHGTLVNGFINSVLGQKGCLKTTEGYNYLAMDDDVWVYTGVTSVSGDRSNVGFVLMNQRTKETHYYEIAGAEEYSAMDSAEGQVQNLKYKATFPMLLNIANEPTYFIALKDDAGLVKMYAMVNIQKYQNVATGDTVAECEEAYRELLESNGIAQDAAQGSSTSEVTGKIKRIAQAVLEGNSHFYVVFEEEGMDLKLAEGQTKGDLPDPLIFDVPVSEYPKIIAYDVGDELTLRFRAGTPVCEVLALNPDQED